MVPNFILSPDMNLPIPVIGTDPGPDWASNINGSLTIIDQHDHTPGNGVPITPSGMNINMNLSLNSNSLTLVKSIDFSSNLSLLTTIDSLYVSDVDLYYNDGNGNQIRLTQSGGVVGSPGSISGLASPASATYVSGSSTFVWQSNANTPANLDAASVIFRNLVTSSPGLTLSPPTLSTNYSLVLPLLPSTTSFLILDPAGNMSGYISTPAIPSSTKLLTLDAAGNMGTSVSPPATPGSTQFVTIDSSGNLLSVVPILSGIDQQMLAPRASSTIPTQPGQILYSPSSGVFSTSSTSYVSVTNLNGQVVTSNANRPVMVQLVVEPGQIGQISIGSGGTPSIRIQRNGVNIAEFNWLAITSFPPSSFSTLDVGASSGANTYNIQAKVSNGAATFTIAHVILTAREI